MPTFIYRRYPAFRIINPATGDVVVPAGVPLRATTFVGGRLTMEDDDPQLPLVLQVVKDLPEVIVVQSLVQCPECGEVFDGKTANANLGMHRKTVHPTEYLVDMEARHAEERNEIIKQSAGYACDVCGPGLAVFPDEAGLLLHTRTFHGAPVVERLSDDTAPLPEELRDTLGSESGGPDGDRVAAGVATEATEIPAAKPSRGRGS